MPNRAEAKRVPLIAAVLAVFAACSAGSPTPAPTSIRAFGATHGPTFGASATENVRPTPTIRTSPVAPPSAVVGPTGATTSGVVSRVVDGDTIVVTTDGTKMKVRYIGMDTPETVDPRQSVQWMGPEASDANKQLVLGRTVVLERDVSEVDQYGRLLRDVWLEDPTGWVFVNLELVVLGYAQVTTYPPDVKYVDELLAAQDEARTLGLGLWGDEPTATPEVTPRPTARPTTRPTPRPTHRPPQATPRPLPRNCDASYPDFCIPPPPPDLDCGDIGYTDFTVYEPDPHRFDGDNDGIGCES